MTKSSNKYTVSSANKDNQTTSAGNGIQDKKPLPPEAPDPPQRSFLERHAFIITTLTTTMIDGLGFSVSSQFKYRFFHDMYSDELHHLNATRNSVCGVGTKMIPEVEEIENKVSAETARWGLYGHFVSVLPMFIASVIIGIKSDMIGRRFMFLLPFFSSFVSLGLLAVVIRMKLHYGYTLIGSFISSCTGGRISMHFAGYALISDTHGNKPKGTTDPGKDGQTAQDGEKVMSSTEKTPPSDDKTETEEDDLDLSREKERLFKIVGLDVCIRLASGVVAFATGYIIQYAGFFYTLVIVLGVKSVLFVFAFIFITETGVQKKSTGFMAPLRTIANAFKDRMKRTTLVLCFLGLCMGVLGLMEEMEILHTYEMSPPFCLNSVQLGWLSSIGVVKRLFTMPLLWFYKRIDLGEATVSSIGLVTYCAASLVIATVRLTWVLFVFPLIAIPGSLSTAVAKAIITRHIGRAALASTFAVMLAGEELFMFAGSSFSNFMYQKTVSTVPTAPFFLSAASFAVGAFVFAAEAWRQHNRPIEQKTKDLETNTEITVKKE